MQEAMLDLAAESWRFLEASRRAALDMDVGGIKSYTARLNWYASRLEAALEACGWKIVNLENQVYDAGMALKPLNLADFKPDEMLVVDRMLEPLIIGSDGETLKRGVALLRRG